MKRILLFILPILIIVAAGFTIFGFFQVRFEEEKALDDLKRKARTVAESIEFSCRHILLYNDLKSANRLVESFQKRERLQGCVIYNKDSQIIAITERILDLKAKDKSTKATISVNASSLSAATSTVLLSLPAGTSTIAYESPLYTYENVLANGSFEMGMWGEKVGDCNKYDDNGLLAMSLNTQEKTDGNQSIQLEATRHIACTSIRTAVASSSTYMLSFDYQSPNAKIASYYVGYNDPAKTSTKEDLKVESASWHSFSKIIEVPSGATTLSLYLYAKSTDRKTNIINRYDNVQLIEVPDLRDAFYLVSEPIGPPLVEPRSVSFDLVNPTKKLVHIKGATAAFFLAMSESYHDQWQLQLNNEKVHGFLEGWWPFAKPDRVGDEYHYKLNGFLNGWYVDTAELCAGSREEVLGTSEIQTACTQNADGSYDIEFVIEFWPQRWFYLGLLISGTTLLGCLGYLGYEGVRRLRRKQYV